MRRVFILLATVLLAIGFNFLVAFVSCAWQPVRFFVKSPSRTPNQVTACLVKGHPEVADCIVRPYSFEASTGVSRRVEGAIGFDDSHFVAGRKATGATAAFQYGSMIQGARDVEDSGIEEDRFYIPIGRARITVGWPFPALVRTVEIGDQPFLTKYDLIHSPKVPLVPLFPGFIWNTSVYFLALCGCYWAARVGARGYTRWRTGYGDSHAV